MEKISWDDIPSLEDLEIDWEYTPENPLGRREWARMLNIELYRLIDAEHIAVRIVSRKFSYTAYLLDLSPKGLALLVNKEMQEGVPVKVGFFIGKHKVTSKGIVRNCIASENNHRVGIEFVDLAEEHASFIIGINSSRLYEKKH